GDGSNGRFEWPRDRHFHLLDRHDAVVDADDDAREVRRRKDGDGKRKRLPHADHGEGADQENDRLRVLREPVTMSVLGVLEVLEVLGVLEAHDSSGSSTSLVGAICTLVFSSTSGSSLNSS